MDSRRAEKLQAQQIISTVQSRLWSFLNSLTHTTDRRRIEYDATGARNEITGCPDHPLIGYQNGESK